MKASVSTRAPFLISFLLTVSMIAAAQPPQPQVKPRLGDFVLYAERSIEMDHRSHTEGGEVGVRTAMPRPAKGGQAERQGGPAQLRLEEHAKCGTSFSPSTSLDGDAEMGKVWTDSLRRDKDTEIDPAGAFPATLMPPLPLASASGSGQEIKVEEQKTRDLTPGTYGAVSIEEHGTLRLTAGRYTFASVKMAGDSKILGERGTGDARRATGLDIHIVAGLEMGDEAKIEPEWDDAHAKDFTLEVAGADPSKIERPAFAPPKMRLTPTTVVSMGRGAKIHGLLAAPHGTIWMSEESGGKGAFAAFDIKLGEHVEVEFQDGFSASAPGQQGSQQLHGYFSISPDPNLAPIVGPIEPDTPINLVIGLPVRDPVGLKTFVKQVSDPDSPNFRKYITQPQFIATYSPSSSDYMTLQTWATSNGFTITSTYPDKLMVNVTATAAQIQQALYVNLVYRLRKDGSKFVAADRDPSLDLSVPLLHIAGLTDFFLPRRLATATGNGNLFRAVDIRQAYLGTGPLCPTLTGAGQVIGILEFAGFSQSDIVGYDNLQNQNPLMVPPLNPANVTQPVVQGAPLFAPSPSPTNEASLDIEVAQAMAPAAAIQVFLGSVGITSHEDDLVAAMANASPALTTMSSSWETGRSDNAQQSLDEMASRGISIFEASGDFGDVGDPQDTLDMDSQTLVGGTFLQTNTVTLPPPSFVYSNPYYAGETTWNQNPASQQKGVTGGGIMDGNNQNNQCYCWPHGICCGSGVAIPSYQLGVNMSTNGGSSSWRNYPDVALLAANVEIFYQGGTAGVGGTSAAAPLWAAFTALVNQNSLANGMGMAGFLNTTLYDIGGTSGQPGGRDLYQSCFHDIKDGVSNANGFGSGFRSVAGYDLTTGWGTPQCALVGQLSTLHPRIPNQPESNIRFVFSTSGDDLRKNHCCGCGGTGLTADVLLQDGTSFPVTLKGTGTDELWDNNTTTSPLDSPIPNNVVLTPTHGIKGVTLTIHEQYSSPGCGADNWDMSAMNVSIFTPPFQAGEATCQFALTGTGTLQDGNTGLNRFSENADSKGSGETATFLVSSGSGCP